MSMIFRAFLLFSLSLPLLGTGGLSRSASLYTSLDNRILRTASVALKHAPRSHVINWLRAQRDVRSVTMGSDRKTISIRFLDGTESAILPASWQLVRAQSPLPTRRTALLSRSNAPGGAALIMEPFATQLGLGPNAGDVEVNYLQQAGYHVDQLYDTQVTIQSMSQLSHYNVVYVHTHSGNNAGGEGVVATGQLANNDASVANLIQNGSVIRVAVSGGNQEYYGITSSYINTYEGQFPTSSILFLNGCNMLDAPLFYLALKNKGLGVLVSWDKEATSQDNYLSGAAFFTEMAKGLSVADALKAEKDAGYGKSQVNGGTTTLGFIGDGTITLQKAASGQINVATPKPVINPTASPITPSPTSTPTVTVPKSGPPLSFTLQPVVKPGAKQVMRISSSPDTVLHIQVSFPSGDRTTTTTATDGSGVARYVYVQHSSRVTFNHVLATVTVQATKDGGVTTLTNQYRIGWSPVDASVIPRDQAVGKVVYIWVHARANIRVRLGLHFPVHSTLRLHGKTNSRGWVRIPYRVGRYLKDGTARNVSVRAAVKLHHRTYSTYTSFSIL